MKRIPKITAPVVLLAAVALCSAPSGPATGANQAERARLSASQERRFEKRRQELVRGVRGPLAAFVAEPPGSCASANLQETIVATDEYRGFADRREKFEFLAESAGLLLDVADAAADRDCQKIARELYRAVITIYVGTGYAAYRQRAEIGLADLRARGH